MSEIIAAIPILIFGYLIASICLRTCSPSERSLLWVSFGAHQVSAVLMVIVTSVVYGWGDLLGYHRMGMFLAEKLRGDFLGLGPRLLMVLLQQAEPLPLPGMVNLSNTGSMQALSGFLCLVCSDSVYGVCLLIASMSFVAKLAIYRSLKAELPGCSERALLVACVLVPSAVFWSSGLLKEPIACIGLAAMVHGAHSIIRYARYVTGVLSLAIGSTIAALFKAYLLPSFGIGAGLFLLSRALFASGRVLKPGYLALAVAIAIGSIVVTGAAFPRFAAETFFDEAQAAQVTGERTEGGSNYSLGGGSLMRQVPLALATVLYRPLLFEASNILVALNAVEMSAAIWLTLLVLSRRRLAQILGEVARTPALCFCVGFVLTLAIGVGLTTTNLGTLSRYRVPFIPFYATLFVALAVRRSTLPVRVQLESGTRVAA
jgi:hypothetical protein